MKINCANVLLDKLRLHSTLVQAVCYHRTDVVLSHPRRAVKAEYQRSGRLMIVNMSFHQCSNNIYYEMLAVQLSVHVTV